jgi:hypothetical protein
MKSRITRNRARNIIVETADAYLDKPMQEFIKAEIEKKQWVYKVLSGEKEADQVIFKNSDFIVLPDTEGADEPGLNWMVIFTDTKLLSMRELTGEHIPMLKSVRDVVASLIPQGFSSPMLYWHYPPSVWCNHLHVCAPCDMLRTTSSMQRVHFADDVISNLSIDSNFYQKATITYILPSSHELSQLHNRSLRSCNEDIICKG